MSKVVVMDHPLIEQKIGIIRRKETSLDLYFFQRQILGSFIADQHCDLADILSEILGTGLFSADDSDLLLD